MVWRGTLDWNKALDSSVLVGHWVSQHIKLPPSHSHTVPSETSSLYHLSADFLFVKVCSNVGEKWIQENRSGFLSYLTIKVNR